MRHRVGTGASRYAQEHVPPTRARLTIDVAAAPRHRRFQSVAGACHRDVARLVPEHPSYRRGRGSRAKIIDAVGSGASGEQYSPIGLKAPVPYNCITRMAVDPDGVVLRRTGNEWASERREITSVRPLANFTTNATLSALLRPLPWPSSWREAVSACILGSSPTAKVVSSLRALP